jgi:protein-disulfide isomerase
MRLLSLAAATALTVLPLAAFAQEAAAPAAAEPAAEAVAIQEMALGQPDAPVTVIEYGSLTCPHCATWHQTSLPQLKAEFVDEGQVRYVFREVYFDRFGLWASMVARCGGEMRFFPILDQLYAQQRDWVGDGQPAAIADNLRRIGLASGLGAEQIDACLRDEAQAEALVAWYQANAEADGIDSTPSFVINGEKHSNMAWADMRALIEAELAEAGVEAAAETGAETGAEPGAEPAAAPAAEAPAE